MGLSRSSRITLLLCIDVVFFFVELIVGYAVGSLALISDSFHMLNDVMSLVVALYAIKLSGSSNNADSRYTYGWHRAEILAALINGVFLLALCFSIAMEALERFFSTPDISQPRLVVIVGCLGLASNIVGLFLFHEHGHSHGGHSHSHGHDDSPKVAESHSHGVIDQPDTPSLESPTRNSFSSSSMYGHPAATRASITQVANDIRARSPSPERPAPIAEVTESTLLLHEDSTDDHEHSHPNDTHAAPHSHSGGHAKAGSMNMDSLILHVLGDALGNVGVIATGLIIWLTEWKFKYYCDPVISLVITAIIFSTALPLVRSTSLILLQGVPSNIDAVEVKHAILDVEGVLALHELHIWQLSETKIIASVHVTASKQHEFMPIAKAIRTILHQHGIHSSTIQPEYQTAINCSSDAMSQTSTDECLVVCPIDAQCDPKENACCPPPSVDV